MLMYVFYFYQKYLDKGREGWASLQNVLRPVPIGLTQPPSNSMPIGRCVHLLSAQELTRQNSLCKKLGLIRTAKSKDDGRIYYTDPMSPSIGTIVAKNSYGRVTDLKYSIALTAPDRRSDVTWYLWKRTCEQAR